MTCAPNSFSIRSPGFGVWEACIIQTIGMRNVSYMLAGGLSAPLAGGRVQIHKIKERLQIDNVLVKLSWAIQCALRYGHDVF